MKNVACCLCIIFTLQSPMLDIWSGFLPQKNVGFVVFSSSRLFHCTNKMSLFLFIFIFSSSNFHLFCFQALLFLLQSKGHVIFAYKDCLSCVDRLAFFVIAGTSACPAGKFYCRNLGSIPQFIFSSRVNDHICGKYYLIQLNLSSLLKLVSPMAQAARYLCV